MDKKVVTYYKIELYRPLLYWVPMNDQHFAIGFELGDFDVYHVSQSES